MVSSFLVFYTLLGMLVFPDLLLITFIPLLLDSFQISLHLFIFLHLVLHYVTLPLLQLQDTSSLSFFSSLHFLYDHLFSFLLTDQYSLLTKYTLSHPLTPPLVLLSLRCSRLRHASFLHDLLSDFLQDLQLHFPSVIQMFLIHIHDLLILYLLVESLLYHLSYFHSIETLQFLQGYPLTFHCLQASGAVHLGYQFGF